jgi:anthranilate phosphoribosyltransferase
VVCSEDRLDEFSIAADSQVAELKEGNIEQYKVSPESLGLNRSSLDSLRVESPDESLALIKKALKQQDTPASDMIALNAGAAIYAADLTLTLKQGVEMAQDIMVSGLALEKMKDFIEFTRFVKE